MQEIKYTPKRYTPSSGSDKDKRRLRIVTIVFWVLLLYIIAALVWWFIALSKQNSAMTHLRLGELSRTDSAYQQKAAVILDDMMRKTQQYVGEGFIFFLLIVVGAVYVYRATQKQLRMAQHQQNFMMAITHELKTPIAIASLNLETLQKRKLDETQQQRLITSTLQETERLNDLCNNILITSQLESGSTRSSREELELGALAGDCAEHFKRRFPGRQILFETSDDTAVMGDPILLQLLINNLIENAIKYTPKDTAVEVHVSQENKQVVLQVKDSGQGISPSEKLRIFDKFYRIGAENTRNTKGTGLGLYLCKIIVSDHRGTLFVSDNIPCGSIFTASFRCIEDNPA